MITQRWIARAGARLASARFRRQRARLALLPALMISAAGCSQGSNINTSSIERTVPVETAYVLPPTGGPAIVHVLERGYSNAMQQEISLATDSSVSGQNFFRVKIFGRLDPKDAGEGSTSERSLAMTNIGREMRSAVRGVAMSRSPYFVQNRYGPFGYAIGRSGSDMCIYGWQNLRSRPSLVGNKGAVDIRLRLCRANATERDLLDVMYGYTVNAYLNDSNWNPYNPPPVPETLGAAGPEIYPLARDRFTGVLPEAQAEPRQPRGQRAKAPSAPPVVEEPPIGPAVPPPPAAAAVPAIPSPGEATR